MTRRAQLQWMALAVSRDELSGGPTKGVGDPLSKG